MQRSIKAESVRPEEGGLRLFFRLMDSVHGFFLDDEVARDDDKNRIHCHCMGHSPYAARTAAVFCEFRIAHKALLA